MERRKEQQQRDSKHDEWHDQRQYRQHDQQALATKLVAHRQQRDHRSQRSRHNATASRYRQAVTRRAQDRLGLKELGIPAQSQPLQRKRERRIGIDREQEQDGQR